MLTYFSLSLSLIAGLVATVCWAAALDASKRTSASARRAAVDVRGGTIVSNERSNQTVNAWKFSSSHILVPHDGPALRLPPFQQPRLRTYVYIQVNSG
jgi:hypothetical protein